MKPLRFWIEFEDDGSNWLPRPGCGVTAWTYDDAINILRDTIFKGRNMPATVCVNGDVDIRALDQEHVTPNMEAPNQRGVWYPKGFAFVGEFRGSPRF